jgi:DNA repair protein RadC
MEIRELKVSNDRPKNKHFKIDSSKAAYDILISTWNSKILEYQEEFKVILMDRNNQILGIFNQSKGGITGTVVDQRITFGVALKSKATSIILAHNHPAGTLTPSAQDKALTKRFVEAGKLLDIAVLDHLIITKTQYFSFADEGLITV